jgi:hypothetical protein
MYKPCHTTKQERGDIGGVVGVGKARPVLDYVAAVDISQAESVLQQEGEAMWHFEWD